MSASETLRAYLRGRDDINPATVSSLLFFHENDLAAARAESDALRAERDALADINDRLSVLSHDVLVRSDALRAALETITATLQREYDGVQGGDRPPYYGNGILYALHVIHKYTTALAPSPAEPAAPERCATCDRPMLSNAHEWDHEYQPSAPERWGREP